MNAASIQGKAGLLLLAFALLVSVSVGATFWGVNAQKTDALVINLAGRQRMLVEQMTRLAMEFAQAEDSAQRLALLEAIQTFDQTLLALRDGGPAPYWPGSLKELPATTDAAILVQLDRVDQTWQAFRQDLERILGSEPGSAGRQAALRSTQALSETLIERADGAVRLYESAATAKITRLQWVQAAFLACAALLLLAGGRIIHCSVIAPLHALDQAAERIGAGNLSLPVRVSGPSEIAVLSRTMEDMRSQLWSSQLELQEWAQTLEEQVAQRTQALEALYSVSREISSRLDIRHVLNSVAARARQLLGSEVAFLCLLDEDRQQLSLQAASGPTQAVARPTTLAHQGLACQVLAGEQALSCGSSGCRGSCGIMATSYRTSQLAAPLRLGERAIGALCVGSARDDFFPPDAVGLLTKLAQAAAIALENARLYQQAERSATLEERQRIAAEMHDGLAQTIGYLQIMVDQASQQLEQGQLEGSLTTLKRGSQAIYQASTEIRQAISSLQGEPPSLQALQDMLAELLAEFKTPGRRVEFESTVDAPLVLSPQESEQILRVTREALLNAHNHSRATRIMVHLGREKDTGLVRVEDNGRGFAAQAFAGQNGGRHFGLKIMQARAARLGGRVNVQSVPGAGTQVVLSWPLGKSSERLIPGK